MTDEEANNILLNNDWVKFSDARELLQMAWGLGYSEGVKNQPAASGEPVALVCMSAPHWMTATAGWKVLGPSEVQPQPAAMLLRDVPVGTKLYATAQPAPALVPLTDQQLCSMRKESLANDDSPAWAYEKGVRDAENAHGIGTPAKENPL